MHKKDRPIQVGKYLIYCRCKRSVVPLKQINRKTYVCMECVNDMHLKVFGPEVL